MKTVGIIGGLGPGATSKFYLELIYLCQKFNKINRPKILIYSVPIPYNIEKSAIISGKDIEKCIPLLLDSAKKLENAGADFLVMPCNSLHIFIEDIKKSIKIPVLSIISETVKFLRDRKITKVGIISTEITNRKNLYGKSFLKNDIKEIFPDHFQQKKIGKIIHNLVLNKICNNDRKELLKIIDSFNKKRIKNIVLACTDLQLLVQSHPKLKIHDTMGIFLDAVVREIFKEE